jgi:hypothetical protein
VSAAAPAAADALVAADALAADALAADVTARAADTAGDALTSGVVPADAAAAAISSAVVIGRAGEAEPVAAGVALALRGRAPAAAVIVVAAHAEPNTEGGTRAARRLAARFDAHGFAVAARGRLAWAYATPDAARRAARIGDGPAVLAITVPLEPELEDAIAEADLAIVVARDEGGPLAELAAASLACPTVTTRPLPRGAARLLARHGLRAPGELHALLSEQLAHICHKRA